MIAWGWVGAVTVGLIKAEQSLNESRVGVALCEPYLVWMDSWPEAGVRSWAVTRVDTDDLTLWFARDTAEHIRSVGIEQFILEEQAHEVPDQPPSNRDDREAAKFASSGIPSLMGTSQWSMVTETSFGWPFRCQTMAWTASLFPTPPPSSAQQVHWALKLPVPQGLQLDGPWHNLYLPTKPRWNGLLLNSGIYGTIWALPLLGLPLLKQRRRRRKGHCPHCNYDLKRDLEHGCPECGWGKRVNA